MTVSATAMLFGVYGQSTHTISALPVLALEKYLNATAGTRHLRASATWGAGKNRRQVDHGHTLVVVDLAATNSSP